MAGGKRKFSLKKTAKTKRLKQIEKVETEPTSRVLGKSPIEKLQTKEESRFNEEIQTSNTKDETASSSKTKYVPPFSRNKSGKNTGKMLVKKVSTRSSVRRNLVNKEELAAEFVEREGVSSPVSSLNSEEEIDIPSKTSSYRGRSKAVKINREFSFNETIKDMKTSEDKTSQLQETMEVSDHDKKGNDEPPEDPIENVRPETNENPPSIPKAEPVSSSQTDLDRKTDIDVGNLVEKEFPAKYSLPRKYCEELPYKDTVIEACLAYLIEAVELGSLTNKCEDNGTESIAVGTVEKSIHDQLNLEATSITKTENVQPVKSLCSEASDDGDIDANSTAICKNPINPGSVSLQEPSVSDQSVLLQMTDKDNSVFDEEKGKVILNAQDLQGVPAQDNKRQGDDNVTMVTRKNQEDGESLPLQRENYIDDDEEMENSKNPENLVQKLLKTDETKAILDDKINNTYVHNDDDCKEIIKNLHNNASNISSISTNSKGLALQIDDKDGEVTKKPEMLDIKSPSTSLEHMEVSIPQPESIDKSKPEDTMHPPHNSIPDKERQNTIEPQAGTDINQESSSCVNKTAHNIAISDIDRHGHEEEMDFEYFMDFTDSQLIDVETIEDQPSHTPSFQGQGQTFNVTNLSRETKQVQPSTVIEDGTPLMKELIKEVSSLKQYLKNTLDKYEQSKNRRYASLQAHKQRKY